MTIQRCFPLTEELANPRWRNTGERCKVQDAEILALQDLIIELDAKIRDLEAVQAKLAGMVDDLQCDCGPGIGPNGTYLSSSDEIIAQARRECGIKDGGV